MEEGNLRAPSDPTDPAPAPGAPVNAQSDDVANQPAAQAPPAAKPPPAKKKRRRRWPYVVLGLLLLLGLLVVLLPTIAGTGPARIIIVGQINQRLNGRIDIADWSLGWTSPLSVTGLRVYDAQGVQVIELPKLTTGLTLLDAVRGRLHFGKVTVEGLNALIRRNRTGEINLAQLLPSDPQPQPDTGPTKLPDMRGELHLVNCRATFEDQIQGQTFFFPSIAGVVKCPDINGSIENALEVACKVGDAPQGKLTVAGRADVAENFVVDADKMDVEEKVTVEGVDLGSFGFALGKDAPLETLAGLTSGAISLRYRGGEGAGVEAKITSTSFAAGGPALKGDTFATRKLTLTVPPTTLAMPAGTSDWKTWALRVGSSGGGDQIVLTVDQGTVALGADAPLSAVANLADNLAPGAAGQVRAAVDLDVGALATQMPRLLALQEGLTLSSGRLTHVTDLQLAPDRATIHRLEANLTEVRGQRGQQPVSLQPINLGFTASTYGGGWTAPKVRDLNLNLTSGFANAAFTGQDLASLSGRASGDLGRLREELGQVFDLGELQLSGPFDVQVASKGNVAANEPATLSSTVTVTDLLVQTAADEPALRQSRVLLKADGTVLRRPDGSVDRITDAAVTLNTGDVNRPTIAARIDVPAVAMAQATATPSTAETQPSSGIASATYNVAEFAVDLQRAKAEFVDFVPALREYDFDRGVLNVTGGGRYDNGAVTYDGRFSVNDLTLARAPAEQAARAEVIRGYTLTTETALSYAPRGDGTEIQVTKLAMDDERGMLSLRGAPDMPLRVVTTAAGGLEPSGRISLNADLKQLNDVLQRLNAEPTDKPAVASAPRNQSAELRSGRLTGTIDLAQAAQNEFFISSNLQGTELTVAGAGGDALTNETIAIVSMVRARNDLSAAFVDRLDVTGNVLTANVSGTALQLKVGQGDAARAATPVEMVQSATVKATAPDLGKLQALLDALAAPEATSAAAARPAVDGVPAAQLALQADTTRAGVYFAQARQAPPPNQIIGRRPQPAPAQRPAQPQPQPQPRQPRPVPAPAADAVEEPAPPIKLAGGSASLSLIVQRQDGRVVVTPEVMGQNVALRRGEGAHTLDAVELKTSLSFVPVAPPAAAPATAPTPAAGVATKQQDDAGPSFAEQMHDLRIPSLTLRGAGTTVTLAEPVAVSDVSALQRLFAPSPGAAARGAGANPAAVKAAVRAEGDVGQLSSLLVALGYIGDPTGPGKPYTGTYALDQRLSAGGEGLAATGQLNLTDFAAAGNAAGGSSFNEKAVRFANDVTLDAARDALSLRNVSLAMESTQALELKLSGKVLDYSTQRRLENVEGTIGYDWAKLWEIVRPMLSREQQENLNLRVAGQAQRQFALGGSYPAVGDDGRQLAFHESIRSLTGHFIGGFQLVEVNGLQVQNLELPLTLREGKLVVAYHDRPDGENYPPAADCNSGKLNIGGATVDLTDEVPRLSMAKNTKLLDGATLNPVFSDMFGGMINNPLFVSPKEARGLVDITVVQCDRLPLDTLVLKNARENDGRAEFVFSIREVFLGNSTLMEALKLAGQTEFASSLQGEIRESRVIIERGATRQDVTINTGESERPWRIRGSTALETSRLDLTLTVPPQLLRQLGSTGRQAAELLPEGLPIPLGGTTRAPQLDLNRALTAAVKEGLIPGLLRRATGGDRGEDRGTETPARQDGAMPPRDRGAQNPPAPGREPPPATEPPKDANPLGDLFDAIGRQREQREREKQEEREKRRRERERQQQGAADPGEARPAGGASGSDRIGRQPARGRDRER